MGDNEAVTNKRKGILQLLLVYLLFVLINIVCNRLVKYMGLPLYVDNIGTTLAAVFGGYLPGIFVGYMTNILNSTADIENTYYAGVSVLIAVTITFFANRGFFKKLYKALIVIPFLAIIGGGVGYVITYFMYGPGETGFLRQCIYEIGIDVIDKAVTIVIAYGLIKLLPKGFKENLSLTDWRQKPLTQSEKAACRTTAVKGLSLRNKFMIIVSVIMLFIAFVTTTISYVLYKDFAIEQFTNTGTDIAKLAAATIDADRVNDYFEEGDSSEDYQKTKKQLEAIKEGSDYIEYLYVYQIREDGCYVVFDIDTLDIKGEPLGTIIDFDKSFADYLDDLLAGNPIDPIITNDTYGWLLTDYEPVYDSSGKCVCYACADINMNQVRLNGISFLAKVLSLFVGFFILIWVLCLWFTDYHLTYPIDAMTFAAGEFAYNSDEDLEVGVERLKSLNINTGDEIENLYQVLTKTISESVGYIEDVKTKGEQIAFMQNGLIYIMADLVESRDKCTGDHVKKTAAYVRLILKLLKENNLYPEQITDEYIADVINSAPLHDVGKIKVSDVILNKPGRLTDEEFELMKIHTVAGQEIIESAMKLSNDPGYLKEALNLATYHHEKWDGSGYPKGLKGEEIPLSARIMAVSDVFDALVSARSYKKPFSFEEAMIIIEDGIGSHFDPVIAKVFVDNRELVREIAEENKRTIG